MASTCKPSLNQSSTGFTTYGTLRAPAYMTTLDPDFPIKQHSPSVLQNDLQAILHEAQFELDRRGHM